MKAGSLALLAVVFLGGSATAVLAYKHLHPQEAPYLAQAVERKDIESTVNTLGHIADSRDTVEASVPEAEIFKLHPGQQVFFDLVAVPDSRFEGTVREVKAMPIAAFAAEAEKAKAKPPNPDEQAPQAAVDPAEAMSQPSKKRDIFSSNGDGVFYKVVFDMGATAGRYPAGMSVMTHVVLGVAKQIPAISIAALGPSVGQNRYEIEALDAKGRIVSRQITTGLSDTLSIEIKDGLKPGDKVVIRDNGDLYKPGFRG